MCNESVFILLFGLLNLFVVVAICVSGAAIPAYPACAEVWKKITRRHLEKNGEGKMVPAEVPIDPEEIMEFVVKVRRDWIIGATVTATVAMICVTILLGIALSARKDASHSRDLCCCSSVKKKAMADPCCRLDAVGRFEQCPSCMLGSDDTSVVVPADASRAYEHGTKPVENSNVPSGTPNNAEADALVQTKANG